eukprot:jgi/Mesen1/10371/ME000080S09764
MLADVVRTFAPALLAVGACTGAVAGALAGRATDSGLFRGAGLGAVAGAVVSIEALEASRTFWRNARSSVPAASISSTVEYFEDVLQERLVRSSRDTGRRYHWQLDLDELGYDELYELFGPARSGVLGLPAPALARLPHHVLTSGDCHSASGEAPSCTICLQDLECGETARSLPLCKHTFHMECVDRWLSQHGLCPVCRQTVEP